MATMYYRGTGGIVTESTAASSTEWPSSAVVIGYYNTSQQPYEVGREFERDADKEEIEDLPSPPMWLGKAPPRGRTIQRRGRRVSRRRGRDSLAVRQKDAKPP